MIGKVFTIMAACALALPTVFADDAFVGTWKYNKSKSDEKGQIQSIADLGNNKYKFTFGTISFDITADGTDQASLPGATLAITIADANTWRYVYKANGTTVGTGAWTLAVDGKSIADEFKGTKPDGTPNESHSKMTRVAGKKGFAGTWRVAEATFTDPGPIVITAYGSGGLTISNPTEKFKLDLTMDGKDCPAQGPTVLPGMTSSAKRNGPKVVTMTDKQNGKVLDTEVWKVSADGKTLTVTHHDEGVKQATVAVWEKQ